MLEQNGLPTFAVMSENKNCRKENGHDHNSDEPTPSPGLCKI